MHKKESQLHLKLYLTIIICVVIAISATSTILYVNFQSILMKHEYKAQLEKMESEAAQISKFSDIALSTLFQIYNDISVKKLLTYNNLDAVEESAAFIQLRSFLVTIPYVDSIYVYSMNNNRIYIVTNEAELVRPWSPDYYTKTNDFYDKSAVDMIENCTDYIPYIPIPRYYKVNDEYTKCVYTYMMYNTFSGSNRSNAVMLNLEAQYLFQEESKDEWNNISLVIDQNDYIVYSNTDKFQALDQLQHDFDRKGNMDKEESGYYLTKIDGTQSVVIFTKADNHQWRYVSIIEYDVLLSQVRKLQTITIIISLLIAFIGGLAAHMYSKRITVPIHTMSKNIKNLQFEKRRTEIIAKNLKLIELLDSGGLDHEGSRKTGMDLLSLIGWATTKGSKLVLICLHIDGYKSLVKTGNTQEIHTYKFAAVNILSELMGEIIITYCFDFGIDKSLIFLKTDGEVTKEFLELHMKQMQLYMKEYFSISISAIVSGPEEDPGNLFYMYEKIKETISRSIFLGEGYITYVPESDIKSVNDYEYPEQKEKHLMEHLHQGKAEEAWKIYENIISETYQYPIIIYNMVINRLIFAINNVVNLVQKNGITPSSVGFIALSNLLQDFDTLEKRNEKFYELFTQIRIELENRKSEKQEQIIVRINRMIDLGFENPSFSLDLLADSIGMSSAHMCRIYKQYTGNTINDLLVNKRMDKARQLLTSTTMSVNEIAEKVGYTNPTYFYRVFKKTNGVTPIEFRRK